MLGHNSLFAICEGLAANHTLKVLMVDNNILGDGGMITSERLIEAITNNHTLQILQMDHNRFGKTSMDHVSQGLPCGGSFLCPSASYTDFQTAAPEMPPQYP